MIGPDLTSSLDPYLLRTLAGMVKVVIVFLSLSLIVAYVVFAERKILAHLQARLGPMRVGPHGLLQPIADGLKLLLKEDIVPAGADKILFLMAPVISLVAAFTAFSLIPFASNFYITDVNVGLLFLLAISSTGVLGLILGGWSSNSHYPLLGALRATAQLVSYEVALGFAIITALLLSNTLSMVKIVEAQAEAGVWFVFWQPVAFFVLMVAGVAETNRNPFDLPEAESELVAGFHTEYSGFRFSLYFLAEYAAMILMSAIGVTLFLGGWLRPFQNLRTVEGFEWYGRVDNVVLSAPVLLFLFAAYWCVRHAFKMPGTREWFWQRLYLFVFAAGAMGLVLFLLVPASVVEWVSPLSAGEGERNVVPALDAIRFPVLEAVQGVFWFMTKIFLLLYGFIWFRGTFPRYRFDQLMNLGWRFMIPVAMANVIFCGVGLVLYSVGGWNQTLSLWLATAATLLVAWPLAGRRS